MLRHEDSHRTDQHNRRLAGSLAFIAGFVNSAGFILIGTFTSHVTGNIGRLSYDAASGDRDAATLAATMIFAFFMGAFIASMAIEASPPGRRSATYGRLLLAEAVTLAGFLAVARLIPSTNPRVHDAQAALLCAAMGLQNSLVTRLSGAVVRTTHLTGVLTDIGIEAARWFRHVRHHAGMRGGLKLTISDTPVERPHGPKVALLLTILGTFVAGAILGALTTLGVGHFAILAPACGLLTLGVFALVAARDLVEDGARR
jgi:uncharacterized membrane protein YoaK (UPF0700 family)